MAVSWRVDPMVPVAMGAYGGAQGQPGVVPAAAGRGDRRAKVLVVEDHPALRSLIRRVLRGHDVLEAGNAERALEVIREDAVDLVVLDLRLPGADGMDLLRRLRRERHRRGPSVFVLTGVTDEATKVEALTLGAQDYMTKPFSFSELRIRVGNVLARRARVTALQEQVEDLERQAFTDELTGCGDRHAFDSALLRMWSEQEAEGTHVGLVLLDVDHLEDVNATSGDHEGDRVLVRVAAVLLDTCRVGEGVYRVGGDEFAVLVVADPHEALRAARRIHAEITEAAIPMGHRQRTVTVSAGVAAGPAPLISSPEALLSAADRALYLAKRTRDTVILSGSSLPTGSA